MAAVDTKPENDKAKDAGAEKKPPVIKDTSTPTENRTVQDRAKEGAAKGAADHLSSVEIQTKSGATVEIDKSGQPVKFEEKGKTWTTKDGKTFTNGSETMELSKGKDGDYQLLAPSRASDNGAPKTAESTPPPAKTAAEIAKDATNNEQIGKQSASDLTKDLSELNTKARGVPRDANKVERNATQIETDVRALLSSHNSAQMDQIKKDFQADPVNKGKTLEQAIAANPDLSQATKDLANVYLKGNDKRTDADTKDLATKALTAKDPTMFQEVMRDATPQARQDFLKDQGEKQVHKAFDGWVSTKDADHAMDYVKYGKLSAATQISDSTGVVTKNSESIELALKSMTDDERTLYKSGQQLTEGKTANLTPEQQQAKDYYTKLHDQINASGNNTEQIKWNDMAATKGGTFVSELADERHMLGANVADVSKRIEDMSQKDWEDLRQHPERQAEVRNMLSTIDSNPQNVDKYMALYDAKMKDSVKTYLDSQNVGLRPLTERLEDSNHVLGADTNGMLDTLSKMTPAEKDQLKNDPEFRKTVQDYLKDNLNGTGLDSTNRLLDTYIKDGSASKGDILSKLEGLDTKFFGDRNEAVRSMQKAFKDDPTLRDRINNPTTPEEKKYAEEFKDAAAKAMGGLGYYEYGKDLIEKGQLPLEQQMKLNNGVMSNDYPNAYKDLINATPEEKAKIQSDPEYQQKVLGFMDKEHQQIAMAVLKQGEVKPEDLIRTTALGWGGSSQIVSELGQIKPADLKAAEDAYTVKYGTQLADDVRGKVSGADKVTADRLLAGTLSAEEQARVSQLQTEKSRSGFGAWMADNVFRSATGEVADEALQQTAAKVAEKNKTEQQLAQAGDAIKNMTPEQMQALQAHLDSQIVTAAATENKATDDHVEVKQAAANYTADGAIAAVSVGSMILTGGLDTPLIAGLAVAGAGIKVGAGAALEGNDYDSSAGHIASDAAIGSITAVTSALGPGQIAAVFKVGTQAALDATAATVGSVALKEVLSTEAKSVLEKGGTDLIREAFASGAKEITKQQFDTLAASAVSSSLEGQARQDAIDAVSKQLSANLAKEVTKGMTTTFIHQGLNLGAGAAGGGLGSGTEAATKWDATKSVAENMAAIAEATAAGAASGGIGAGGMTTVIAGAKKAIGAVAAKNAERVAATDAEAVLRDAKTPVVEAPPVVPADIRPEIAPGTPAAETAEKLKLAAAPDVAPHVEGVLEPAAGQALDKLRVPPTQELDQAAVNKLWEQQAKSDGVFKFKKGYYEASINQVDEKANPNGLIFSSSEKPIKVADDLKLPNGQTIKAGTELPNGVQLSPGTVEVAADGTRTLTGVKLITPAEGVRLADGTTLNSSEVAAMRIKDGADAKPGDWVIQRPSTDDNGAPRIDTYAQSQATKDKKWLPVEGKPGVYAPNNGTAGPVEMTKIPDDMRVKFMASYGEDVSNKDAAYLVKSGDGNYIITQRDLRETYVGADGAGTKRMNDILKDADAAAGSEVPRALKPVPPTQELDQAAVNKLWEQQAKSDGVFKFKKGYYEASINQVDEKANPNGLIFSSSEKPIKVADDLKLPNGQTIKAGTELPNGVQLSPGTVEVAADGTRTLTGVKLITPAEGVRLADGTTLNSSEVAAMRIKDGADAKPGDWVIQRPSTDDNGAPRIDTYAQSQATKDKKWLPVEGKPGVYAPNNGTAGPVEMTKIPDDMRVKFMASYGEDVSNKDAAYLVKSGDGNYIITQRDLRETYVGADGAGTKRMNDILKDADAAAGSEVPRALKPVPPTQELDQAAVNKLWEQQAKSDGVFKFKKGYYEASINQVDEKANPNGLIFSSSEKPIKVADDLKLPNGQTIKAGTELPNGVQLSPGTVEVAADGTRTLTGVKLITPAEGVRLADGTTLNSSEVAAMRIKDGADAKPGDWVIQRPSTDDNGAPRIDTYAQSQATKDKKWLPVEGKPGVYAPNNGTAGPVEMTKIPDDMRVKFMASYGEDVSNKDAAYLVKSGDGNYIITQRDLRETYVGADGAGTKRMKDILKDADAAAGSEVPRALKPVPPTQELDQAAVNKLWEQQAKSDGVFKFKKGYYEASINQVDEKANPNGLIFSSSEKPIKVADDLKLPNGQTIKAGTELPNGVQLSPGTVEVAADGTRTLTGVKLITPAEGVRLADGTTLNSSEVAAMRIKDGADAKPGDWVIQRPSTDDNGAPRIDTYAQSQATKDKKWLPVEGKPGVYAPNNGTAGPVEMTKIPDDMRVKFMASYGEDVSNKDAAYLVKSGDGNYIITQRDLRETYVGADGAGTKRMKDILKDADAAAGSEVPRALKPVPPTQELDQAAVDKLWEQQAKSDGVFKFKKGYYEASINQVDEKANPNGLIFSSSEKPIKVADDLKLPNGQTIKAGTELPNGVQLSPGTVEVAADGTRTLTGVKLITPAEGVRLADGTTLNSSEVAAMRIKDGADAKPGDWVIQRPSTDDNGAPRIDTYAQSQATKDKKWLPVEGKPGVYAPNNGTAGPVEMTKIPDDMRVKFMASYGEDASNKDAAYLVKSGDGHYIITQRDLRETYVGADGAGTKRMKDILKDADVAAGSEVPRAAMPAEKVTTEVAKPLNGPGYPDRAEVRPDTTFDDPTYQPPRYTAASVLKNDRTTNPKGWADSADVTQAANKELPNFGSAEDTIKFSADGKPLNPLGPTGIGDRGLLGKWGPNHAADPIVTRIGPDGKLQALLVERQDSPGTMALPGGMVDAGEMTTATLKRELGEETSTDLNFDDATPIYKGYVADPRNTDNAWMETDARHLHLEDGSKIVPKAGDDAAAARWQTLDEATVNSLYGDHAKLVHEAILTYEENTHQIVGADGSVFKPENGLQAASDFRPPTGQNFEYEAKGIYGGLADPAAARASNQAMAEAKRDFNVTLTGIMKSGLPKDEIVEKLRGIALSDKNSQMSSEDLTSLFKSFRDMGKPEDMTNLYNYSTNSAFKDAPQTRELLAAAYNKDGQPGRALDIVATLKKEAADPLNPKPELMNGEVYGAAGKAYQIRQAKAEELVKAVESGDQAKIEAAHAQYAKAYELKEGEPIPPVDQLKAQAQLELNRSNEAYTTGFRDGGYGYYCGINAAWTSLAKGDLSGAQHFAELTSLATKRDGGLARENYWTSMSMLESSLVSGADNKSIINNIEKIVGGNVKEGGVNAEKLKSTTNAWVDRVMPALEKMQSSTDPEQAAAAKSMLERFTFAKKTLEAAVKDPESIKALTEKVDAAVTPADHLFEKSHSFRGMAVDDADRVTNNFPFGGIITDTSVGRADSEQFRKLFKVPVRELMDTIGGDQSTLPAWVTEHTTLADVKDPAKFIDVTQPLVRANYGTVGKNLEIIDSVEHLEQYDHPMEAINEGSGIPPSKDERVGFDSRSSLAAEWAKGLGDCRQHAQAMQKFFDESQNIHMNEALKAMDFAKTPAEKAAALANFNEIESTQLRIVDLGVKVPIKTEKIYKPTRPTVDTDGPAKESFIKDDKVNPLEDHTLNMLFKLKPDGSVQSARFADSFYQTTYDWANRPIDLNSMTTSADGKNIDIPAGVLKHVQGAENGEVPVTVELAVYSGKRDKTTPGDTGAAIYDRGLVIPDFDILKVMSDRKNVTANIMAMTKHMREVKAAEAAAKAAEEEAKKGS